MFPPVWNTGGGFAQGAGPTLDEELLLLLSLLLLLLLPVLPPLNRCGLTPGGSGLKSGL